MQALNDIDRLLRPLLDSDSEAENQSEACHSFIDSRTRCHDDRDVENDDNDANQLLRPLLESEMDCQSEAYYNFTDMRMDSQDDTHVDDEDNIAGQYGALQDPSNSFRLLQLHHGHWDDLLEATLTQHTFDVCPIYDAVSYSWTEPGQDESLALNGINTKVRPSLWQFLRTLRHSEQDVLLWADALCIRQDDPFEKSAQVQMIGRIFRGARHVRAWLGGAKSTTNLFFQCAKKMPVIFLVESPATEEERAHNRNLLRDLALNAPQKSLERAVCEIFSRRYWTRRWIMQECIVNQSVVMHCGSLSATWDQFSTLYKLVHYRTGTPNDTRHVRKWPGWKEVCDNGMRNHRLIAYERSIGKTNEKSLNILAHRTLLHCTDPRDHIYAQMELLKESKLNGSACLVVDYSITRPMLCFRALYAYLNSGPEELRLSTLLYLLDELELKPDDVEQAVCETVDPSELFLPLRYIIWDQSRPNNKAFSITPNTSDPERIYNIHELYAADFERLATGNLENGGPSIGPPEWWDEEKFKIVGDVEGSVWMNITREY